MLLMQKVNFSTVCKLANFLRKQGANLSAALKQAWRVMKAITSGETIQIEFVKDGGEIRTAASKIKSFFTSKAGDLCFRFVDTNLNEFRSFRADRLLSVA